MTDRNRPRLFEMKLPASFTGKTLISLLGYVYKEMMEESLFGSDSFSVIEQLFLDDEQGSIFWTQDLAINVLEIDFKANYGIHLFRDNRENPKILYMGIKNPEIFKGSCRQLLEDLLDPNKKYLMYRRFVKRVHNMDFHEKLAYYENQVKERIALKKKFRRK